MKLKNVAIGEKAIKVTSEANIGQAGKSKESNTRKFTDTILEEPLPEFSKAIADLIPVAINVCEFEKSYSSGLVVVGLSIHYTKQGSRSVILHMTKKLEEFDTLWKFNTPQFHVDKPEDGESFVMEVKPNQAAKVLTAIFQAEKYRDGERSQQLLFDSAVTEEQGGEDELIRE